MWTGFQPHAGPMPPTHANMPIWSVMWFHVHLLPRSSRFLRSSERMLMIRSAMPLTSCKAKVQLLCVVFQSSGTRAWAYSWAGHWGPGFVDTWSHLVTHVYTWSHLVTPISTR